MRDLSKMLSVIETVTIKAQLAMQQQILYLSMLFAFFDSSTQSYYVTMLTGAINTVFCYQRSSFNEL